MKAKADSWQCQPFAQGIPIPYRASFNPDEFARLKDGLIPQAMEDKWFVYFEEPFLFFHRSWTGQPVYRVKLQSTNEGASVEEALVSTDTGHNQSDVTYEAQLLDFLISNLILGGSKPFPLPSGLKESTRGVFQHHIAGTGYAEVEANEESKE